jgi:hypothetical protein
VRVVIAVANQLNLPIVQLDVKSAILNGKLEEEVYVEKPQGFKVRGAEDKELKLTKPLKIERFKELRKMLKVTSLEYLN